MLASTLRPDGTVQLGDFSVVGAASANAALADSSDASYLDLQTFAGFPGSPAYCEVSLGNWVKGTATVTSIVATVTTPAGFGYDTPRPEIVTGSTVLAAAGAGPTTTFTGDLTQAQLDDLRIRLRASNNGSEFVGTSLSVAVNADFPLGGTTTVTIDSVTTEDAAPTVAPHRVSSDPAHDDAEVRFTPTHDGQLIPFDGLVPSDSLYPGVALDIIGWKLVIGPVATGRPVAQWTNRASPNRVCGARAGLHEAVSSTGFRVPSGTQVVVPFTFADASDGGADGARTVSVYALTDMQGWA